MILLCLCSALDIVQIYLLDAIDCHDLAVPLVRHGN